MSNNEVEGQVFRPLNLYEGICVGIKRGVYESDSVELMRGDALRLTWRDYGAYIAEHRDLSPDNARAWIDCEEWINLHPGGITTSKN